MPSLSARLDRLESEFGPQPLEPGCGMHRIFSERGMIPAGPYDGDALISQLFDALSGPDDYLSSREAPPTTNAPPSTDGGGGPNAWRHENAPCAPRCPFPPFARGP